MHFKVNREPFKFHSYLVKFFSDSNPNIKNMSHSLVQKYHSNDKVMCYNPFNQHPYGKKYLPVKSLFFLNMCNNEQTLDW